MIDDTEQDAGIDPADDDFLAFWAEHRAEQEVPTRRILGIDVPIPNDMPLSFESTFQELEHSQDMEDIKRLVGLLFTRDVVDQWYANGVTIKMLQILLAWGMSNAGGKAIEFAEAAQLVTDAEKAKEAGGKAPTATNRAGRRASSKTAVSAGTGRSSKAISRASTA